MHLTFPDGVRGLAALDVIVLHLMMTQDLAYLMPLMCLLKFPVGAIHLSPYAELASRLSIARLAMLPIIFVFHRLFERPFMSSASLPAPRVAVSSSHERSSGIGCDAPDQ